MVQARIKADQIRQLKESKWWESGEPFRAADFAQLVTESSRQCSSILRDMVDKGEAMGKMSPKGHMLYSRPALKLNKMCWRHNHDIYEEINADLREQ